MPYAVFIPFGGGIVRKPTLTAARAYAIEYLLEHPKIDSLYIGLGNGAGVVSISRPYKQPPTFYYQPPIEDLNRNGTVRRS